MSTLAIEKSGKTAFGYLLITLLTALFGAVYELFSHGVYSYFMIYAFGFPLIGGVLPFFALHLFRKALYPTTLPRYLYHSGIATVTAGSLVQGILDIYGTTNGLTVWYWLIGAGLILLALIMYLLSTLAKARS